MMLNIRDLIFHPKKYVRDLAVGLEDGTTVNNGGSGDSYELGKNRREKDRSRIAFASTITDIDWCSSFGPEAMIQGTAAKATTTEASNDQSISIHEREQEETDSGHIIFVQRSQTPTRCSTPDPYLNSLKTIHEGGSVSPV